MEEDDDLHTPPQVSVRPARYSAPAREEDEDEGESLIQNEAIEPPVKMETDESDAAATTAKAASPAKRRPVKAEAPSPAAKPKAQVAVVSMGGDDDDEDDDDDDGTGQGVGNNSLAHVPERRRRSPCPLPLLSTARDSYLKTSRPKPLQTPSEWESVRREAQPVNEVPDVKVDSSKLPLDEHEGEQVLHFYWLDAYEPPFGHKAGSIYLFGKVCGHCWRGKRANGGRLCL